MKIKKNMALSGFAIVTALSLAGCSVPAAPTTAPTGSTSSSNSAPVVLPVTRNPIRNQATNADLSVVAAGVEDLVDPVTKKAMNDRLMLTLKNTGTKQLTGFEVYYEMTDAVTGTKEGYYQKLDGFTLAAGAQGFVYFDNQSGAGHYPENQFSIYRSSKNQVDFKIQVSAKGAKIAEASAKKSVGTGEKVD